jgi:hypothetical protein
MAVALRIWATVNRPLGGGTTGFFRAVGRGAGCLAVAGGFVEDDGATIAGVA